MGIVFMKLSVRTKVIFPSLILIVAILSLGSVASTTLNNSKTVNERLTAMYHVLEELYSLEVTNSQFFYAYLDLASAGHLSEKDTLNQLASSIEQSIANLNAMAVVTGEERELLMLIKTTHEYAMNDVEKLNKILEDSSGKSDLQYINEFYFQYIEPISQNINEWRNSDKEVVRKLRADLDHYINQFKTYVLMLITVVVATFLFTVWWNHHVMTRPIMAISRAVSHFSKNNLEEKIAIKTNDELGVLADDINHMAASLTSMHEKLEKSANIDPLTGALNRRTMDSIYSHEIETARRNKKMMAVAVLDIDHFKKINDSYGHHAGDHVLVEVSNLIKKHLRQSDYSFRIGGEEFMLLLSSDSVNDSLTTVERIRLAIAKTPIMHEQHSITVTASIGVSHFPHDGENQDALGKLADTALYMAKETGRNRTIVFRGGENDT